MERVDPAKVSPLPEIQVSVRQYALVSYVHIIGVRVSVQAVYSEGVFRGGHVVNVDDYGGLAVLILSRGNRSEIVCEVKLRRAVYVVENGFLMVCCGGRC